MRERADEMAALLDEAAPRAQRTRRRRATAVPAAVAAFGALSIGGVGLALGLTPTGAEGILPASPSPALSDPASSQPTTSADATAGGTPTEGGLDPAVAGADLVRADDHDTPGRTGPAPAADPRGQAAPPPWSTRAGHPTSPRPGPTTTRPRPTSSRPTPTSSRSATPRSTSTRPGARTASATPRPVAQRADLPSSGTPDQERDTTSPTTATSVTRGTGGSTG
ncbi:MAG TPA: hypothetical protein VGH76_18220 [Actinomycetospora sp.]|jgi:hypothetical protein|uniref:hypothetical protein n=1 Tax=Actinomycetospora sp. TaxID=1872135 RepID=UPI002F41CBB1